MDMITCVEVSSSEVPYIIGKGYSDQRIFKKKVNRKYNTKVVLDVITKNADVKVYSTWGKVRWANIR